MSKNIPKIVANKEQIPPENPVVNILYINHFGFKTSVEIAEIFYHPILDKYELYSFEIKSLECFTHLTSDVYSLEELLSTEDFNSLVSDNLYNWLENNSPLNNEQYGCSIKEWNEDLFFTSSNNTLLGSKIICDGKLGPNGEPWINFYDSDHFEGEDFTIEVLNINETNTQIKLKVTGMVATKKILFIGWFPLNYVDPRTWVKAFFNKIKIEREFKTYFHYFNKYNIDQSPEWQQYSGNYAERIIKIANDYDVYAELVGKTKSGQDQWVFREK